ncbi:MAG: dephospho-CoA kinase [Eubacteriales bacterium]|nr:dephospho-CoA kinase [Eubacteriales bacterium]
MTEEEQKTEKPACASGAFVLGVTGGVGSGKSSVLSMLKEDFGFKILQTDLLAKELMQPGTVCFERLKEAFGTRILAPDGTIDKKAYADLIYGDERLQKLSDAIVHPAVWEAAKERIASISKTGIRARIALETALPSREYKELCTAVLYVFALRPVRITRLMESRGYSYERCLEIMESQPAEDGYMAYADAVLDNGSGLMESRERLSEILRCLTRSQEPDLKK